MPQRQSSKALGKRRLDNAEYMVVDVANDGDVNMAGDAILQSMRRRLPDPSKLQRLVLIANAGVGFDMPMLFNPKAVVFPHTLETHIEPWM